MERQANTFDLSVAGLKTQITLSVDDIEKVYSPLLADLFGINRVLRTIVFLAGPPGSGKSTFAAILQALAKEKYRRPITILPMDGFHFSNRYLAEHEIELGKQKVLLASRKGRPETFDLASLRQHLEKLRKGESLSWPIYDRQIHDVIPAAVPVPAEGIFLIEGNYLLLDEPGWRDLKTYADRTFFLTGGEDLFVERLIARHIRGGKSPEVAREWVLRNDRENLLLVLTHSLPADRIIKI